MPTIPASRRIAVASVAVAAALTLSGCTLITTLAGETQQLPSTGTGETGSTGSGGDARPTSDPVPTIDSAPASTVNQSAFDLQVGDCLDDPESEEIYEVTIVPCDLPHDYEVISEHALPDGTYPLDIDDQAETLCLPDFESVIGISWYDSVLDLTWFSPTTGSWAQGDRLISCIVADPDGPIAGSLAGSRR